MGLEQPEDMFMVHILPPLHAVGQDGSLCCLSPRDVQSADSSIYHSPTPRRGYHLAQTGDTAW